MKMIMDDNDRFMHLVSDHDIEPQEIIEELGDECPSFYTLKDHDEVCSPSGFGCLICWLNAIDNYREEEKGREMKTKYLEMVNEMLAYAKLNDTFCLTTRDFRNFENEVIDACEKAVAKKINNVRSSRDYELAEHNIKEGECPECGETTTGNYLGCYCGSCGQKIDWGYEDEN